MLTPVENRAGIWLKREDLHHRLNGVNGAKLRACEHLIGVARDRGYTSVVSAASVLSPQNAMAATVAASLGMPCEVILGGSKPSTAIRHPSVQLAVEAGAHLSFIPVGYNPALQRAARQYVHDASTPVYHLQYGITVPPGADVEEIRAFHAVGADQVLNLPPEVDTLVVPFGSGNSAAGVLYGLSQHRPPGLERVILMGIGPDRQDWLAQRLALLDAKPGIPVQHISLYPQFAKYGDAMKASWDGLVMHPTYEGKIITWCNQNQPEWWARRDGRTCLWVVGGPLPAGKPVKLSA